MEDCADEALVTLDQPLADRVIIDTSTGEQVDPT